MKIEYNIVSFGTEKQSCSAGYMAVTECCDKKRYILPVAHNVENSELVKGALTIKRETTIEKIVLARFGLMTQLVLENQIISKNKKVLIVGTGCVGYACVQMLLLNGYKKVFFTNRKTNIKIKNATYIEKKNLNYEEFDVIVDATGDSLAIKEIFEKCKVGSKIILLGTCRENGLVDVLDIHRKNLAVYGAHELSGYSDEYRQKIFEKTLNKIQRSKNTFSDIVSLEDKLNINKTTRKSIYLVYCNFEKTI